MSLNGRWWCKPASVVDAWKCCEYHIQHKVFGVATGPVCDVGSWLCNVSNLGFAVLWSLFRSRLCRSMGAGGVNLPVSWSRGNFVRTT